MRFNNSTENKKNSPFKWSFFFVVFYYFCYFYFFSLSLYTSCIGTTQLCAVCAEVHIYLIYHFFACDFLFIDVVICADFVYVIFLISVFKWFFLFYFYSFVVVYGEWCCAPVWAIAYVRCDIFFSFLFTIIPQAFIFMYICIYPKKPITHLSWLYWR